VSATRLAELKIGERGRILKIHGADAVTMRLLEMGLTPGTPISLVGKAPLGDPWEFEVRGYRLSLRRGEAERVEIQPVTS